MKLEELTLYKVTKTLVTETYKMTRKFDRPYRTIANDMETQVLHMSQYVYLANKHKTDRIEWLDKYADALESFKCDFDNAVSLKVQATNKRGALMIALRDATENLVRWTKYEKRKYGSAVAASENSVSKAVAEQVLREHGDEPVDDLPF